LFSKLGIWGQDKRIRNIQNIVYVIYRRLINESNQVKETIAVKAEKLSELPKIQIPTVGARWLDRWKIGEAPRSNGTHKKHGGTLGYTWK